MTLNPDTLRRNADVLEGKGSESTAESLRQLADNIDLRLAGEISRARDQIVAQRDEAIKRAEVAEEIVRLMQPFAYAGGQDEYGQYVTSVLAKCSLLGDLSRIMKREQHMAFECGS